MLKIHYDIYTDGACSQNGTQDGGWAYVVFLDNKCIAEKSGFKADTTNNEMELMAFLESIKTISQYPNATATFHLDSAYVINAFEKNWVGNWLNNGFLNYRKQPIAHRHLWEEIIDLFLEKYLREDFLLEKVKGHSNNKGNNRADYLATEARKGR